MNKLNSFKRYTLLSNSVLMFHVKLSQIWNNNVCLRKNVYLRLERRTLPCCSLLHKERARHRNMMFLWKFRKLKHQIPSRACRHLCVHSQNQSPALSPALLPPSPGSKSKLGGLLPRFQQRSQTERKRASEGRAGNAFWKPGLGVIHVCRNVERGGPKVGGVEEAKL